MSPWSPASPLDAYTNLSRFLPFTFTFHPISELPLSPLMRTPFSRMFFPPSPLPPSLPPLPELTSPLTLDADTVLLNALHHVPRHELAWLAVRGATRQGVEPTAASQEDFQGGGKRDSEKSKGGQPQPLFAKIPRVGVFKAAR